MAIIGNALWCPSLIKTYSITTSNISTFFTVSNSSYYFAGSGSTWTSNNKGVKSSTAQTTLTALKNMKVTFSYSYSSEASYDKFYLTVAGTAIKNGVSGSTTTGSYTASLTAGQTIIFKYTKDGSVNKNNDCCTFYSMTVTC